MFYFLPNMLLSGFIFPFQGMPLWAQWIGRFLPLTHFNRLVRGILLKGNGWSDLWPDIWPLVIFTALVMVIAAHFYRSTLD
jgi:ABC-2 type transport system permease protein